MAVKNEPLGGAIGSLRKDQMRLGDTLLYVSPEAIKIHRQMRVEQTPMLRGQGSIPTMSGYSEKQVTFQVYFPGLDRINSELRAIVAQVKRMPFLPVESITLNQGSNIHALAITSIGVDTVPMFPNVLRATIQGFAFDPATYLWNGQGLSYAQQIDWNLFRWHYGRSLEKTKGVTYLRPALSGMDNGLSLSIMAEDDLVAIRRWRTKRNGIIRSWMEEKADKTGIDWEDIGFGKSNEAKEKKFVADLDEHYKHVVKAEDARYEPWDFGDALLTDVSISHANQITAQVLSGQETPMYQYLGAADTTLSVTYRVMGEDSLSSIENFATRSAYIAREYGREKIGSAIQIDSPMADLFGVQNAVLADHQVDSVAGLPHVYDVSLIFYAYNRLDRKAQEVDALTMDASWNPLKYVADPNVAKDIALKIVNYMSLGLATRPMVRDVLEGPLSFMGLGGYLSTSSVDVESGSLGGIDEIKQAVYEDKVNKTFELMELYPDLELPTYEEVERAGFKIPRRGDGLYVDPDFFIRYDDMATIGSVLSQVVRDKKPVTLVDGVGGRADMSAGGKATYNKTAKEHAEEARAAAGQTESSDKKEGATDSKVEAAKKNGKSMSFNSRKDFEGAVRGYADEYGVNGRYAFGLVLAVNPSLAMEGPIKGTFGFTAVPKDLGYTGSELNSNGLFAAAAAMKHLSDMQGKAKAVKPAAVLKMKELSGGDVTDAQAKFLIAAMYYLGYEKETNEAMLNGKMSASLSSMRQKVEDGMKSAGSWKKEELEKARKELKVSERVKSDVSPEKNTYDPTKLEDPDNVAQGMLHDMMEYDQRGRLVRAFPTFLLLFIDEGRYLKGFKLSDQFFRYQAVSGLMYTNSAESASSVLTLELMNTFGALSDASKRDVTGHAGLSEMILSLVNPSGYVKDVERSRRRPEGFYNAIHLTTGVRVHVRLGFGSSVSQIPTLMNGTITSMEEDGDMLTVIAQDDGVELARKIRVDANTDTSGFLTTKKEPMEIVDELLTDSQGFFKNIWAGLSNKEYDEHSLGLMHFGRQGVPQGVEDFMGLMSKAALGAGFLFPRDRQLREINMNVHPTSGITNQDADGWWNQVLDQFGMGEADEVNININLFDKTVWDVLAISASIAQDYVLAVHPFGFRNTIFLGKPYFPIVYGYEVEGNAVTGMKTKTFRQMHYIDSQTSILSNDIKAIEDNMFTVAVGVLQDEGELRTTRPVFVDTNIWPEKQKTMNVDTTLNAKGVWLFDKTPLVGGLLNKPFKWAFDEGVALKIAASSLRDSVKKMYDGYIMTTANPSLKPYDYVVTRDAIQDMEGTFECREVTHFLNQQMGCVSIIKPSVLAVNGDTRQYSLAMAAMPAVTMAGSYMGMRKMLSHTRFAGNAPILNAVWAGTKRGFGKMTGPWRTDFTKEMAQKYIKDPSTRGLEMARVKQREVGGSMKKGIDKWKKDGSLKTAANMLDMPPTDLEKALKELPGTKKMEMIHKAIKFDGAATGKKALVQNIIRGTAKGGAKSMNVAKGAFMLLMGVQAAAGPIGWAAMAVEMVAFTIISATVSEFVERWLGTRQAVSIAPMKKSNYPFTAGINGHAGSVIGDDQGAVKSFLGSGFGGVMAALVGIDTTGIVRDDSGIEGLSSSQKKTNAPSRERVNMKEYYEDLRAVKTTSSRMDEIADQRFNERADYGGDWSTGGLGKLKSWFSGVMDKIEDILDGDDNDDVPCGKRAPMSVIVKPVIRFETSGVGSKTVVYDRVSSSAGMSYGIFQMIVLKNCGKDTLHAFVNWLKGKDKEIHGRLEPKLGSACYENGAFHKEWIAVAEKYKTRFDNLQTEYMMIHKWPEIYNPVKKATGIDLYERSWAVQAAALSRITQHSPKSAVRCFVESYKKGISDKEWIRGIYEVSYSIASSNGNNLRTRLVEQEPKMLLAMVDQYKDKQNGDCAGGGNYSCDGRPKKGTHPTKDWRNYKVAAGSDSLISMPSSRNFNYVNLGGSAAIRKASFDSINKIAKAYKDKYGKKMQLTSTHRPSFPDWHATGYAIDVDTPNTMRPLPGGGFGFASKKEREEWKWVIDQLIDDGWDWLIFGDSALVNHAKKRGITAWHDTKVHHNHLHMSVPLCKK
ncbi:hypothetical protein C0431_12220 [bacterium]|nr:hypothetical protein [bacterium]